MKKLLLLSIVFIGINAVDDCVTQCKSIGWEYKPGACQELCKDSKSAQEVDKTYQSTQLAHEVRIAEGHADEGCISICVDKFHKCPKSDDLSCYKQFLQCLQECP